MKNEIRCPFCNKITTSAVVDSRQIEDFTRRRWRMCRNCGRTYTTLEQIHWAQVRK